MNADFWHDKWEKNEIGFHMNETNPILIKYFKELDLDKQNRIFIPLCGKTLDIKWLLSKGYNVVGVELNMEAVKQLFIELNLQAKISKIGNFILYSAKNIDIFIGDIFELNASMLGFIDAVYDRAALVALPQEIRVKYVSHLMNITNLAPQLLISYEYDQKLMNGPPFSVSINEVRNHYIDNYKTTLLETINIPPRRKGKYAADECVWILRKLSTNQ